MPVEVAVALIGLIEAVGVAVIGAIVQRNKKNAEEYRAKREKEEAERAAKTREREEARTEFLACMYDLTFASATGTEVLLHQAHGDKINGNVNSALKRIGDAKSKCSHLQNRNAAEL